MAQPAPMDASDSPVISPYLIMQAKAEAASGKPPVPGGPVHQLGTAALKAGISSPDNPAGAAGSAEGDPNAVLQSPALKQLSELQQAKQAMNMPASVAAGKALPVGTSMSAKSDVNSKNQTSHTEKTGTNQDVYEKNLEMNMGITHDANGNTVVDPNHPYQQLLAAGKQQQDLLANRAAQPQAPRPTDLSGLMMAADFENGGNQFQRGYEGQQANTRAQQQDQDKKQQQLFEDQNQILKDKMDLQKSLMSSSATTLNGGTNSTLNAINTALQMQQGFNNSPKGGAGALPTQFMNQTNKLLDPILKDEAEANKVTQLASSQNPADMQLIKEALTRMMTGARPAFQMVEHQAQDPGLGNRLETAFSRIFSGNIPAENTQMILQLVADLNKVTAARKTGALQRAQGYGDSIGLGRDVQASMLPESYTSPSPELNQLAAREGAKSQAVAQGKAAYAAASYDPDVVAYSQKHGITLERAKQIKSERGGK